MYIIRMNQNNSSKTALVISLVRACSFLEHITQLHTEDRLASLFIPKPISLLIRFQKVRNFIHSHLPKGLYEWLILRTKFIDEIFSKVVNTQIKQIVIFGAGFDTRSIRFSGLIDDIDYFEIDLPEIQITKKKILKQSKTSLSAKHHFIPLDLNQVNIKNELLKSGIDKDKPTLFIFEGILMYFQPKKVKTLLEFSASFTNGSQIIFDYIYKSILEDKSTDAGGKKEKEIVTNLNEDWLWGIDKDAIKYFLPQNRCKLRKNYSAKDLADIYFKDFTEVSLSDAHGIIWAEVDNMNEK